MSRFRFFSKLRTLELWNFRTSPKGFTIFETIAVLTVISITLAVVLGAYSSWATVHALDGAVRTLEAGLLQARTTAKAKNTYVMFVYETGYDGSSVKLTSGFQSFISTNDTDRTIIISVLEEYSNYDCPGAGEITDANSLFTQQFPPLRRWLNGDDRLQQRLTGHIELGYVQDRPESLSAIKHAGFLPYAPGGLIVFCPDGSVWSWNDKSDHTIVISTRKRFAPRQQEPSSRPLHRILRINLATGATTTFRPEQLPD